MSSTFTEWLNYKRSSTIDIVDKKSTDVTTYIVHRLFELFASDTFIQEYIDNWYVSNVSMKKWYMENIVNPVDWVIAIEEYQSILDTIRKTLPKKYSKKGSSTSPWFDNTMPIIDMIFWPKSFELAELEKSSRNINNLKANVEAS